MRAGDQKLKYNLKIEMMTLICDDGENDEFIVTQCTSIMCNKLCCFDENKV